MDVEGGAADGGAAEDASKQAAEDEAMLVQVRRLGVGLGVA